MQSFLTIILSLPLLACEGKLAVMPEASSGNKVLIAGLDRLAARSGESLGINGKNLSADIAAFVNNKEVSFSLKSSSSGQIILPDALDAGLQHIVFKRKGKMIAKFPLLNGVSVEDLPIQAVAAESVCDDFIFKNQNGHLLRGLALCAEAIALCNSDGQSDCEASTDFPAVLKATLPAKLPAGESLAGVQSHGSCPGDSPSFAAVLNGEPTGTSDSSTLRVEVGGDDITQYKFKVRSPDEATCSAPEAYSQAFSVDNPIATNVAAKPNGPLELCVLGMKADGEWQSTPSTSSWTKNSPSPNATFNGEPMGSTNSSVLQVSVAGTDLTAYKYKIRRSTDSPCSDSSGYSAEIPIAAEIVQDLSSYDEGSVELCVIGRDAQGHWQAEALATSSVWTMDRTAAIPILANAPQPQSSSQSLAVSISGSSVTHYKYKIRSAADPACSDSTGYSDPIPVTSPIDDSLSGLADGVIELCVLSRDGAGNWQSETAATTLTWTKDTAPPTATISGAPIATNNTGTLQITVAGIAVSHYKYKLRDSSDSACSNATGYSAEIPLVTLISDSINDLADGTIEICVIGRDSAGNWQSEATATVASWTKDFLPPMAALAGGPTGSSSDGSLNISVAGTDVVAYKHKVREASSASCADGSGYSSITAVSTPITDSLSALNDGPLQVCVIGRDSVGNWQLEGTATTLSWIKDTTAPIASISDAPSGSNNAASLNVTIAGTGTTHYRYKIRNAAALPCSNSAAYGAEQAVSVGISDSLLGFAEGSLELCVIGRDAAGNWQLESAASSQSWIKDTTAPTAAINGAPTGTNADVALNISVAGSDVTHYKYKIRVPADAACSDAAGYSPETSVATLITSSLSSLSDGMLQLCVMGRDSLGNWQTAAAATSASWTKDSTAPIATVSGAPSGSSLQTVLNITIAGTGLVQYKYKIRVSADAPCSNGSGYSSEIAVASAIADNISALSDGVIEVCVIGRDSAGNWQDLTSASAESWTKDTAAPTATVSGEPSGSNNALTLNVSIAGTGVSYYKYKVRVPADLPCSHAAGYGAETAISTTITASLLALADAVIELCVIGRDSAGNWQTEAAATTVSWTKDSQPPAATISGEPTGISLVNSLDITVAGTDVVQYKYKIRANADSTCSDSTGYSPSTAIATHIISDISAMADGNIQVCVIGRDSVGNWQLESSATSVSWTRDTSAPTATQSGAPSGSSAATILDITVAGAEVSHYKYKIRASADSACWVSTGYSAEVPVATHITDTISAKADGTTEICLIGRDSVGNWQLESAASSVTWTKDTIPPTATIVSGAPSGTSATTSLDITIGGTGVTGYKYKIRSTTDTACSDPLGYLAQPNVALPITNSISSLADGTIELCVIGLDAAFNWQSEASATTVTWQKDALLPTVPTALSLSPRRTSLRAQWTSGGGDVSGFIVLRRAASTITEAPAAGTTYSAGNSIGASTVAYVGSASSFVDSSLLNGTKYYYRIFAYDAAVNYSSGLIAWGRPVTYEPPAANNLLFWTDVSYSDSFFLESSCATPVTTIDETIGCWKDLTGHAATLIQASAGKRPIYKTAAILNNPGLRHSDDHWLKASSSSLPAGNQQHTLVFIGEFSDTGSSGAIHIGSAANDGMIKILGDSGQIIYAFGNNDLKYTAPSTPAPKLFFGTYNGLDGTTSNRKFYINNVESSSVASSGTLSNTLDLPANPAITLGSDSGATQNLSGDSGEFLLYDRVLSASERAELSKYAWDKWDIPQIDVSVTALLPTITLNWTDGSASASYLIVRRAGSAPIFSPVNGVAYGLGPQGADEIVYASSPKTYTHSSPTEGTTYHYALYGNDGSNNYTSVISKQETVLQTPTLSISPDDATLNHSWAAVSEANGFLLVRRSGSPPTFVPSPGITYATGAQGSDSIVYVGTASNFQDTGLSNGTTYHYKLYAYDSAHNYAASNSQSGTPIGSCSGSTTTYTANGSVTVPAGCGTVEIEAWGAGGGGGSSSTTRFSGAGGKGGKALWNNVTASVAISSGQTIAWVIGQGGACGTTRTGGGGSANAVSTTNGKGGDGGSNWMGSAGSGSGASGGNGAFTSDSGYYGANGAYGGGGGGAGVNGTTSKGGGGGGATAASVAGTLRIIAGGGGGGGGAGSTAVGGPGGGGCSQNGSTASNGGGGGGGGDCVGTSETAAGGANGGSSVNVSTCTNNGSPGKVIVTFSP